MENTGIEWTDHTFNPWWGCNKVSPGCKHCYAETFSNRFNTQLWGPDSERKPMSPKYWRNPIKWNEDAGKKGIKAKVFCASMADVFEGHPDTLVHLERLFKLIEETPNLIWQLLTKRPENIMKLVPKEWHECWPANVWIGTSCENQQEAEKRIPILVTVPAQTHFLSCEPLLGPIDFRKAFPGSDLTLIKWIIVGGESGPKARPMSEKWVLDIVDELDGWGIAFFFKQWGEHDSTGKKVGKKNAGSELDGKQWKQFPDYNTRAKMKSLKQIVNHEYKRLPRCSE